MTGKAYLSAYQRKEIAREKRRAQEARNKLRKMRGTTPSPERDRHWNSNTRTSAVFDPSIRKVDIFRLPKRKVEEKGRKRSEEEKKKVTAQEAIASAIESILHPTDKQREEEEIESIMRKKQPPPPLSPMGKQLSVAVPSPRLTEVVKVLEASTSPLDENVLNQISGTIMKSNPSIEMRTSREYIDSKGVRLHNTDTDFRNAGRRVIIRSPDGQQQNLQSSMDPNLATASATSPRNVGSRSPRRRSEPGFQLRSDDEGSLIDHPSFVSPYAKSQESRRKMALLKSRVEGTNAGGIDGLDWDKGGIDVSMTHVDMEETLNNIRMLRRVSGNGMSLGHLQDNLVSKLQTIYRTHDDAVQLLGEMDSRRSVESINRVAMGAPDSKLRPSSVLVPPSVSPHRLPQPVENVYLSSAPSDSNAMKSVQREKKGLKEYYDATHLPSRHVQTAGEAYVTDRNNWQKKPVHLVDEASAMLTYSKTASGQTYGNFGAHGGPQEGHGLTQDDEDAMETLLKFTSSYVPPTNVPSIGATHETAGWAIRMAPVEHTTTATSATAIGTTSSSGPPRDQSLSRDDAAMRASTESEQAALASRLQADSDEYITEAFRQKRLSAVKDFPRLDHMPHDLIQSVHAYMHDLHFMQGVRGAAFGARGVSMKFCMDRATDMIMKELVDKVADEIDKMLAKETDALVDKI